MKVQAAISTLFVAILVHAAHAHISLTFPPARSPDYDFLDNVRTGGPCGVPGEASKTNPFLAYALIEHTWINIAVWDAN